MNATTRQEEALNQTLLLSDDEIVAVAARLGGEWKTGLPTVDAADPKDLIRAAARGNRSLAIRGLLAAEGALKPRILDRLSQAVGAVPQQEGYVADASDLQLPAGLRFAVFDTGPQAKLLVLTLPNGVNEVSVLPRTTVRELIGALIEGAQQAGEPRRPLVLLAPLGEKSLGFAVVSFEGIKAGRGEGPSIDLSKGIPAEEIPAMFLPTAGPELESAQP